MCAGLSPPLCTQPLHYGGEGERYKGPQEMLLQTDRYVLLCDVMGHAAQPFELFPRPWRQLCNWKSPFSQTDQAGACSFAPVWVCSGDAGPRNQTSSILPPSLLSPDSEMCISRTSCRALTCPHGWAWSEHCTPHILKQPNVGWA